MKEFFEKEFETMKASANLIISNVRPIVVFIIFFAIFNLLGVLSISRLCLNFMLIVANKTYFGPDTLFTVFTNPFALLIFLITGVMFSFFAIFEISGLVHAYSMSFLHKKTTFRGMIISSINASKRSLLPKNWLIVLFIIIIMPLTGILSFSSATFCLKVPEFVMDFLMANKLYSVLYTIIYIILLVIEYRFIFAFNYYILGEKSFIEACKKSKKLIKSHYLETIVSLALTAILFFMFSTAVSAIISETFSEFSGENSLFTKSSFSQDFQILFKGFLYALFSPIFNLATLTTLFFKYTKVKANSSIIKYTLNDEKYKLGKLVWLVIIIVFFIGFNFIINAKTIFAPNETLHVPGIVAHRGDSMHAPENTMPAFKLAVDEGVSTYIEFDVHQTKDGKIIVSHDDDLTRVTGKDVYVHELTYDEIMKLDTGAWFSEKFRGTKFSTLDEALTYLKDSDLTIQVEIKPSGYDKNLEETVVDIIKKHGLQDRAMITCLKLDPLLKIEKFAPEMYTVYSMFTALGDLSSIPVDAYTIEYSNISEELVDYIHNAGKKVFAWTLNTENGVQTLVDCKVDGILTDDPLMMVNALGKCDYEGGIKKAVRFYVQSMIMGI